MSPSQIVDIDMNESAGSESDSDYEPPGSQNESNTETEEDENYEDTCDSEGDIDDESDGSCDDDNDDDRDYVEKKFDPYTGELFTEEQFKEKYGTNTLWYHMDHDQVLKRMAIYSLIVNFPEFRNHSILDKFIKTYD